MGQPKAWLPFGDEKMLQRVVRLVESVKGMGPIVVVAAPGQEIPPLPARIMIVRDAVSGRGPLQGLAAGLNALPEGIDLVYASATDVPFLQPSWVERLTDLIADFDLTIPKIDGFHHPLSALYRRAAVLPVIENLLRLDQRRVGSLVESVRTRVVDSEEMRIADPSLQTLRNLNSPDDYLSAIAEAFPGGGE